MANSSDSGQQIVQSNAKDFATISAAVDPLSGPSFPPLPQRSATLVQTTPKTNPFIPNTPFKTLNRILNDIKFTLLAPSSLLNAKPLDYAYKLAEIASKHNPEIILLSNVLKYAPTVKHEILNGLQVTTICGLLPQKYAQVGHFQITISEREQESIDLRSYHRNVTIDPAVPGRPEILAHNLVDEAQFTASNSSKGHTIYVAVFSSEFTTQDLEPLYNEQSIHQRYKNAIENYPDASLPADVVPTPVNCFSTLLKVLRGPLLLSPKDQTKTINLNNPSLNSQIDIKLLFNRLGFTTNGEELVPPDLSNRSIRDAYIRKTLEIIYLASKLPMQPNEFSQLSFSRNLSQVFDQFKEVNQHLSQQLFNNDMDNQIPSLIELSACSFFKDELIIRCFEESILADSQNKFKYVDSLKGIVSMRGNKGRLWTYFVNSGLVGYSDLRESFRTLGIEDFIIDGGASVNASSIIASYESQTYNDPKNYSYFNKHLRTIAKALNSNVLKDFINREILPASLAQESLNIEEVTEDEVVITAYDYQRKESTYPDEIALLDKAFVSLAVHRKSYILLSYIEKEVPSLLQNLQTQMSLDEAYRLLGNKDASDFDLITSYQNKIMTGDVIQLRKAMGMIATERKSEALVSFLNSGQIESSQLFPVDKWPAGLDNIGNTCYLNSLLQYYFCIKPLRDSVLEFNGELKERSGKIGGRVVEEWEMERSREFVFRLGELFRDMINTKNRCVKPARELAYLAFLPISQKVEFKKDDLNCIDIESTDDLNCIDTESTEDEIIKDSGSASLTSTLVPEVIEVTDNEMEDVYSKSSIPGSDDSSIQIIDDSSNPLRSKDSEDTELKEANLGFSKVASVKPNRAALSISSSLIDSAIEMGRQQDVTECIENVNCQIEAALPALSEEEDGEQYDLIKKLFFGKTKQTITPANGTPRTSVERFSSLIINVSDHPSNLYEALDSYFSEDMVHLEEGDVKKSLVISELPEVLQFHVQRVLFDRERLIPYKSLEPIPFSNKLYVDRYLDTQDEDILRKRSEVFQWKSQIAKLENERTEITKVDGQMTLIDTLVTARRYLNQTKGNIQPSTIDAISEKIEQIQKQLNSINSQLIELKNKVANQFNDYTKVGYSIFAIFIHRGEASYGHYWVYIRDPIRGIFRKYNDETVTEVPLSEVMNFEQGNTATPYYIVYVKDELEKDYIEPLKRLVDTSSLESVN